MLFQQLLKKLDKLVTREILLVEYSLIYRTPFGTVYHDILFTKLEYDGIRGITNILFQSFLNDRMQFTVNKC